MKLPGPNTLLNRLIPPRVTEYMIAQLEFGLGIGCGAGASRSGEKVVFDAVKSSASGPLTLFDVGANQGQYATALLGSLQNRCEFQLHCFEPSEKTFKILETNLADTANVQLNPFGLADQAKRSTLFMNEEGSGLASLTARQLDHIGIDHGKLSEEVELRTLTDYCLEHQIDSIDLLKIDVEGHELDVINGAMPLLANGAINMVQFEFGGCNIDTRTYFQDFYRLFDSIDFEMYRVLPSRCLLRIPKYREKHEKFRTMNYLAVRKDLQLSKRFSRTR